MALIPPFFADAVVAIGVDDAKGDRRWVGSGFLYGYVVKKLEGDKANLRIYLVTNRHVATISSCIYVRFNPEAGGPAQDYALPNERPDGGPIWLTPADTNIDVAVAPMNFRLLQSHGMKARYFRSDLHAANVSALNALGTAEGDCVYVLGFPMGLVGPKRSSVIVRAGVIARIRDTLQDGEAEYMVDCSVFPGNSGGPVILRPEAVAIANTKAPDKAYLMGVVKSYIPYPDVAVSQQTGRPRVVFEENSGLALAHPVDYIDEAIAEHRKALGDAWGDEAAGLPDA